MNHLRLRIVKIPGQGAVFIIQLSTDGLTWFPIEAFDKFEDAVDEANVLFLELSKIGPQPTHILWKSK